MYDIAKYYLTNHADIMLTSFVITRVIISTHRSFWSEKCITKLWQGWDLQSCRIQVVQKIICNIVGGITEKWERNFNKSAVAEESMPAGALTRHWFMVQLGIRKVESRWGYVLPFSKNRANSHLVCQVEKCMKPAAELVSVWSVYECTQAQTDNTQVDI